MHNMYGYMLICIIIIYMYVHTYIHILYKHAYIYIMYKILHYVIQKTCARLSIAKSPTPHKAKL